MENNSLRQFLTSLCSSSPWCYAVFWKLHELQNQRLLAYEDGYYDTRSPSQSLSVDDSEHEEYPLGLAIDNMLCRQCVVGEGLVGRVADGGNDLWLYSDDSKLTELVFNLENLEEWLLPVTAGVETTLMAPVLPYGVLQLGSFDKVVEDMAEISDIKDNIIAIKSATLPSPSSNADNTHFCSSIWMQKWENADESAFTQCFKHQENQSEGAEEIHTVELTDNELSVAYELMFPNEILLEEVTTVSLSCSDNDVRRLYMDFSVELETQNEFLIGELPETLVNMQSFPSHIDGYIDHEVSDDSFSGVFNYLFPDQFEHQNAMECETTIDWVSSESPEDFLTTSDIQFTPGSPLSVLNCMSSGSSSEENTHHNGGYHPATMSPNCWIGEGGDEGHLFEAAIATLYQNSDQVVSDMCDHEKMSETSSAELVPSLPVEDSCKRTAVTKKDDMAASLSKLIKLSEGKSSADSLTPPSYESFDNAVVEDELQMNYDSWPSNDTVETPKISKGKARSKNNIRQRPRDRQLIQDRLKELRKLVPNSGKCSIDGLLEQTTKHMMFLRSVTKQANKLRQFGDQKLFVEKSQSDATQPCQTKLDQKRGDEIQSCPIIVKDLEQNGQFLIQMICNRSEVFFEMIEVIHKLKLTIIQGAMECDSRTWARFVVEASEDFNKLDIFWPLMRILQQNGDWMGNQWCA